MAGPSHLWLYITTSLPGYLTRMPSTDFQTPALEDCFSWEMPPTTVVYRQLHCLQPSHLLQSLLTGPLQPSASSSLTSLTSLHPCSRLAHPWLPSCLSSLLDQPRFTNSGGESCSHSHSYRQTRGGGKCPTKTMTSGGKAGSPSA